MHGAVLDLNATPDALPAMAVAACFAEGETRLINVPQARLKETDRIAVMTAELLKLGVDAEELPDGMIIQGRRPGSCDSPVIRGAMVEGYNDHRVVMALAVAALGGCGELSIKGAEAADVTFPGFFELLAEALIQEENKKSGLLTRMTAHGRECTSSRHFRQRRIIANLWSFVS